jgi:muramidase (phage lysozyme)
MATIRQDQVTQAAIRKQLISAKLEQVLLKAAEDARVDVVRVISGGQSASGRDGVDRTGSTRHDNGNAADLELLKDGRALNFENLAERPIFETFVRAAAAAGATGMGAGVGYMGPTTTKIHVGFGTQVVWGAGERAANAPAWLKEAAMQGWTDPDAIPSPSLDPEPNPGDIDTTRVPGIATLTQLQEVIRSEEPIVGPLFRIKNDGTDTIIAYDQSRESPATPIVLEQGLGDVSARDGLDQWVTSGIAIISGNLLSISAYRAAFRGGAAVSREVPLEGRALLDTIAGTESPGYDVIYGGDRFTDFSRHPNIAVPIRSGPNVGKTSSAAGRYQFLFDTWEEQKNELGLRDFSPESQDKAAWHLAQKVYRRKVGRELLADLRNGQLDQVGPALHDTWTSLPGGIEQGVNHNRFIANYNEKLAIQTSMMA